MKSIFLIINLILFSAGCFNLYGLALQEQISNQISSQPHTNYELDETIGDYPESIIFIIADGTGIGQFTVSYYANGEFAPARFDHVGLVATHPNDGECASSCRRVTDSAASGTALSAGIKPITAQLELTGIL